MQAALEGTTAWALLRKLAAQSDMDLRRAVTLAVTALSRHDIPEGQRQYWGSLASLSSPLRIVVETLKS